MKLENRYIKFSKSEFKFIREFAQEISLYNQKKLHFPLKQSEYEIHKLGSLTQINAQDFIWRKDSAFDHELHFQAEDAQSAKVISNVWNIIDKHPKCFFDHIPSKAFRYKDPNRAHERKDPSDLVREAISRIAASNFEDISVEKEETLAHYAEIADLFFAGVQEEY